MNLTVKQVKVWMVAVFFIFLVISVGGIKLSLFPIEYIIYIFIGFILAETYLYQEIVDYQ